MDGSASALSSDSELVRRAEGALEKMKEEAILFIEQEAEEFEHH